jgi:hypothetical protein
VSSDVTDLISEALPLIGVVVGVVLGALFNAGTETRRWRRQFIVETFREQRDFIGQALVSLNRLHILLEHIDSALQGTGAPADVLQRLGPAQEEWRRVLGLMGTAAQPSVQEAMTAYDERRAEVMEAVNAKKPEQVHAALESAVKARTEVVLAVNAFQSTVAVHLARHLLPWRTRVWRRVRGEALDYI